MENTKLLAKGVKILLFPHRRKLLGFLVITSKTVDSALNKDESELGVLVLSVPLQMLAD